MFLGLGQDKPGLKAVLENKKILKILHDCRNDWDSLLYQYSVRLFGFIDTQEAYFVYMLFYKQEITLPISLLNFIKIFSGDDLVKKSQMKTKMHSDHSIWGVRPIEEDMLIYASEDAKFLVRAWINLKEKLNEYLIEIIKVLSIFKVVDFDMFSEFAEYLTNIFFDNYQLVVKEKINFQVLILMDYVYGFFEMKNNEEINKEEAENNIVKSGFDYKKKQRMSCLNEMMKQYESNRKVIYSKNNNKEGFNKGNGNICKNYTKKNNKKLNMNIQNNKVNNESKVNDFNNMNQFYQKNNDNKNKEKKESNSEKERINTNNNRNNNKQNNIIKKTKVISLSKEKPKLNININESKPKSKSKQQTTYENKKYPHQVHPFSELFYDDTDKFYYNNNMTHYNNNNNNHYIKKRTNQYTPIKRNPIQNTLQAKNYNTYYNNYNNGYTNNYNNNYTYYNYYNNQSKQKWKKYNNKNYKMNSTNPNQKNKKYIYYVYSIKTSNNNEPKLKASKSSSSLGHIEQIAESKRNRSLSKENVKAIHALFESE